MDFDLASVHFKSYNSYAFVNVLLIFYDLLLNWCDYLAIAWVVIIAVVYIAELKPGLYFARLRASAPATAYLWVWKIPFQTDLILPAKCVKSRF